MNKNEKIFILGGGLAGLTTGYFAKQESIPFQILEGADQVGGTSLTYSRTIQHQTFLYDSGAHRFHGHNDENTLLLRQLLDNQLLNITAQSKIYHSGTYLDFPLKPVNVVKYLGSLRFFRAAMDVMVQRLSKRNKKFQNFQDYADFKYGKAIGGLFLKDYSEKLWGKPVNQLSTDIAGARLKGLTLTNFILEGLFNIRKDEHLESGFYYPKYGYGTIADALYKECGQENVAFNQRITKINTYKNHIISIEINGEREVPVKQLVSTLPLDVLIKLMHPAPVLKPLTKIVNDKEVSYEPALKEIAFRHVRLVIIFLDVDRVSNYASIYFPEKEFPFTRVFEPKNRSEALAPKGRTSLVVEIPTSEDEKWWYLEEREILKIVNAHLAKIGLLNINDMIGAETQRIKNAYPILEMGYDEKLKQIFNYISKFENLSLVGRSGKFQYTYFHDILEECKRLFLEDADDIDEEMSE